MKRLTQDNFDDLYPTYPPAIKALRTAGLVVELEHTGGGVMTVYCYYQDGYAFCAADDGSGWGVGMEDAEGEYLDTDESYPLTQEQLVAAALNAAAAHGGTFARPARSR